MSKDDLLKQSANFWSNLVKEFDGKDNHPDDIHDIRFHIHAIQHIIYTKAYKEFKSKNKKGKA